MKTIVYQVFFLSRGKFIKSKPVPVASSSSSSDWEKERLELVNQELCKELSDQSSELEQTEKKLQEMGYVNSLDWSRVLDYWNGPLEWTTGVDYWSASGVHVIILRMPLDDHMLHVQ